MTLAGEDGQRALELLFGLLLAFVLGMCVGIMLSREDQHDRDR